MAKTGRIHPYLVWLSENRWIMGINLLRQSAEWYKINAIIQVISTRKFWYPTRPPWILHAILARGNRFPCGLALYGDVVPWAFESWKLNLMFSLVSLQGAAMGNTGRRGPGRPKATAGSAPGITWKDLEQHIVHLSGNTTKGQHQCKTCEGIFCSKRNARDHIIAHHFPAGTFEFNCDGCYERFDTPKKLKHHRSRDKCRALPQE